jgi:hypothetical protein
MKSKVTPGVLAAAIVIVVLIVGLLGWKFLGPGGAGHSEDLRGGKINVSNLNPSDFDQVRKDIEAANRSRNGSR